MLLASLYLMLMKPWTVDLILTDDAVQGICSLFGYALHFFDKQLTQTHSITHTQSPKLTQSSAVPHRDW